MTKNIYIGFDFSMNKPAATVYCDKRFYFYFWPLDLDDKKVEKYFECGVNVRSRGLDSISVEKKPKKGAKTKKSATPAIKNTVLVLIHTIRSTDLANMIISDIDSLISKICSENDDYELYVCSEGLSYGSKGDATLNLATYKGVLLSKIYEHYGDNLKRLFTYSPNTLKSTAGCATKELRGDKKNMINAFINETKYNFLFKEALRNKELVAKTNYYEGVDDLVDSYWALQTMIKEEKLPL